MLKRYAFGALVCLVGCGTEDYAPLTLTPKGDHFRAQGVIDGSTPDTLREALMANPNIKTILMQYVPGSADDEANLEASRLIRSSGITMVVPSGGFIASGGTDMFLAGVKRQIQSGACIGVHSWAAGDGTEGKDLPRDDMQHQLYLSYYDEMGISPEFYWFTLSAAEAEGMHYMNTGEIAQFDMTTIPMAGASESNPSHCDAIASENETD